MCLFEKKLSNNVDLGTPSVFPVSPTEPVEQERTSYFSHHVEFKHKTDVLQRGADPVDQATVANIDSEDVATKPRFIEIQQVQ